MAKVPTKGKSSDKCTTALLSTMQTEAWRDLSTVAQAVYIWLKMEWRGNNFNNNGALSISYRQICACMGIAKADTVAKAFHDLQAKGFVVVHKVARLGIDGFGKGFEYELTELAMPGVDTNGKRNMPRKLFMQWRKRHDFPVKRANANNPKGVNGK